MKPISKKKREKVENYLHRYTEWTMQDIANECGVSPSTVARVKRGLRDDTNSVYNQGVDILEEDAPLQNGPIMSLTAQAPTDDGYFEIKVKNSRGNLVGTLQINSTGIRYRWPNQKLQTNRSLSWNTLGQLMQLDF